MKNISTQIVLEQHPNGLIIGAPSRKICVACRIISNPFLFNQVGICSLINTIKLTTKRFSLIHLTEFIVIRFVTRCVHHRHIFKVPLITQFSVTVLHLIIIDMNMKRMTNIFQWAVDAPIL